MEKIDIRECYWKTESTPGKKKVTLYYANVYVYWVIYTTLIEVSRLKGSCNISVVGELVSE